MRSSSVKLLEFGCGTGGTAILHSPNMKHMLATDISPRMIEIAKGRRSVSKADNVTFEAGSIESLSLTDGSLDAVLGLSILHLRDNKEAAIAKVCRLLKPSGIFISTTICLGDNMKFIKYIAPPGRALGLMPMLQVFTADHACDPDALGTSRILKLDPARVR